MLSGVFCLIAVFAVSFVSAAPYVAQHSHRETWNFNSAKYTTQGQWLWYQGDNTSYSTTSFNDAGWTQVTLPHTTYLGNARGTSSSSFAFISWYRKHFWVPDSLVGRRFILSLDAVALAATVYINGTQIGTEHKGAYGGFTRDITSGIVAGANVIAIKVDGTLRTDFPPLGSGMDFTVFSGIVREVKMVIVDPLYVEWCFARTTNPSQTAPSNPTVMDSVKVVNAGTASKTCIIMVSVVDATNEVVATVSSSRTIAAGASSVFFVTTSAIASPHLWNVDDPYLYTVHTQVIDGSTYVDDHVQRIGIRSITMNSSTGRFYINGNVLKLRGACRHETFPCIGRAAAARVQAKDADILKYQLGCNMVRTSHYTQATAFLDRCDEVGILLMEEMPGWNYIGSTAWQDEAVFQVGEMVLRDRNHPSIFTWAVRINESRDNDAFYTRTNAIARGLDPSRLTSGVRNSNGEALASFLEDIWCRNFSVPTGTPAVMPWLTPETVGHNNPLNSWDANADQLSTMNDHVTNQTANYNNPMVGGVLAWCAFDYHSQHANAQPGYISPHGLADMFRINKTPGYFFQSQRDPGLYGPMVFITHQWESNFSTTVTVVSNCEQVQLYVNGTSRGTISPNANTVLPHGLFNFTGNTYAAGNLRAVGYIGGTAVAADTQYTPGTATHISLKADNDEILTGGDMTRVVVLALDANNQYVLRSSATINIAVSGTANAERMCPASQPLEDGKYAFYVKSGIATGQINCSVSSTGLTAGTATINVVQNPLLYPYTQSTMVTAASPLLPSVHEWSKTVFGSKVVVPEWAVNHAAVTVYDAAGRVLYTGMVEKRHIDLKQLIGASSRQITIIKIEESK
jgi:beta-galactosidase